MFGCCGGRTVTPLAEMVLAKKTKPVLSKAEISLVKKTWAATDNYFVFYLFNQLFEDAGNFLRAHIVYLAMERPDCNSHKEDNITTHLYMVVDDIGFWIEALDKEGKLEEIARQIHLTHKDFKTVSLVGYRELFDGLDCALLHALGNRVYSKSSREAFRKFLHLVYFYVDENCPRESREPSLQAGNVSDLNKDIVKLAQSSREISAGNSFF